MNEHPILPAGYNADDNNGDEVDGAGTNWPILPLLFDSFEAKYVLIVTEEMMAAFGDTCPDYVVPVEYRSLMLPTEDQLVAIGRLWPDITLPAPSNVLVFPTVSSTFVFPSEPDTIDMSQGDDTHTVRRTA